MFMEGIAASYFSSDVLVLFKLFVCLKIASIYATDTERKLMRM